MADTDTIQSLLESIQTHRNTLRTWAISAGLAENSSKLEALATSISGIPIRGSINEEVQEGESYTLLSGYYSGGTVKGVAGGGNYNLEPKTVTPTKTLQTITASSGYYGLSTVDVNPIPDAYQDVTSVTAGAADVLTGKTIVSSTGAVVNGNMPNNGKVEKTLDATTTSYMIAKGYHDGTGTVSVSLEEKEVTPQISIQTVTPTAGKLLSKVTVGAIPEEYQQAKTNNDTVAASGVTSDQVLNGEKFIDSIGSVGTGTMTNNGNWNGTIDGLNTTSIVIPAGYHAGNGTVSLTDDILIALQAI